MLECGTHSRWTSSLLRDPGHEVLVVGPRSLRVIACSYQKNDRKDAEVLAVVGQATPQLLKPIRDRTDAP